jgi:hypothetical protein
MGSTLSRRAAAVTIAVLSLLTACGDTSEAPAAQQPTTVRETGASEPAAEEKTPVNVFTRDSGPGPGGVAKGLIGRPHFPVSFRVPKGVREQPVERGIRGYVMLDGYGGIIVAELGGLAFATERFSEPIAVYAWLKRHRKDLAVDDARAARVNGRPAVVFRYRERDGLAMRDIWAAVGGSTYKDPAGSLTEVTIVEFGGHLLWVQANWPKGHEASTMRAYESLRDSLLVGS